MRKQVVRQKLGKAFIGTEFHNMNVDMQEKVKKDLLIRAVAAQEGITETEALDLILTDETSEYHRKFMLITDIQDLKRRGQFAEARKVEKAEEARYRENNRKEYLEYRRFCKAQQKARKSAKND